MLSASLQAPRVQDVRKNTRYGVNGCFYEHMYVVGLRITEKSQRSSTKDCKSTKEILRERSRKSATPRSVFRLLRTVPHTATARGGIWPAWDRRQEVRASSNEFEFKKIYVLRILIGLL